MRHDGHTIEAAISYQHECDIVTVDFFWPGEPVVDWSYLAHLTPRGKIALDTVIPARPDSFSIKQEATLQHRQHLYSLFGKDVMDATLDIGHDKNGLLLIQSQLEVHNRLHIAATQLRHSKAPPGLKRACRMMLLENQYLALR